MTKMMRDFAGTKPVLQIVGLERTYSQGDRTLEILRGACAEIYDGEAVALVGPSGSGKSSLLHVAGLLEKPGGGSVILNDVDCSTLSDKDRTRMRRTEIGFVYQFHNLLPEFSALENVMMPQLLAGVRKKDATARALELLANFGLEERASHRPPELSGGEQQR
ncbi:MAG: ATP-binding cassette domain-containing protein, partial [Rhodomicrobium sp.]